MANLTKSKTLFGFTSPRTAQKIIPEINILVENFEGETWSANEDLQANFFDILFKSEFYEGESYPLNPAFAARDRITRAPRALGFIDLKPVIALTQVGELLLSEKRTDETFTRQLLKFQLPSPYHTQSTKITFAVKPYLELIRLINDLGSISKTEIALFFLQLTHIEKYAVVLSKIKSFRANKKEFKGSWKMYVNNVFEQEILKIYEEEVKAGDLGTRESSDDSLKKFVRTKRSNMKDYADAFVRYVRATELVTFQKRTFHLVISSYKTEEVNYILKEIERTPSTFVTPAEFKEYLFNPYSIKLLTDNYELIKEKLISLGVTSIPEDLPLENLKDFLELVQIEAKEKAIAEKKSELKTFEAFADIKNVFTQIADREVPDGPLFLEWNVWRAFVMLNYAKKVHGNFIMDTDGMPLNTAPGKMPDLELEYEDFGVIVEVTTSTGNTQFNMEGESIARHFGQAKAILKKEMYCVFIAPSISGGALAHYFNLNRFNTAMYGGKTKIIPMTIDGFIEFVGNGVDNNFSDPSKLQNWLEAQWQQNQTSVDEFIWLSGIQTSLLKWAC